MSGPEEEIRRYLGRKKIGDLFCYLGAALAYFRPENPIEFIISELKNKYKLDIPGGMLIEKFIRIWKVCSMKMSIERFSVL